MPKGMSGRPSVTDKRSSMTRKKVKGSKIKKADKLERPRKLENAGTALTVIEASAPVTYAQALPPAERKKLRMTKRRLRQLKKLTNSQFKDDLPSLMHTIDTDGSLEDVQKQFLTSALRVVLNLLPEIEDKLHTSQNESGTYALKALLAEGREIFHDIRALANTQLVAMRIADTVVEPAFQNIANIYVNTTHQLRTALLEHIDKSEQEEVRVAVQQCAALFAEVLTQIKEDMKERIMQEIG